MTRFWIAGAAVAAVALTAVTGCEAEKPPLPGTEAGGNSGGSADAGGAGISTPDRQAAPSAPAPASPDAETDQELALKLEGIGSKAEMDAALARLEDPTVRGLFEQSFRLCFVQNRGQRD